MKKVFKKYKLIDLGAIILSISIFMTFQTTKATQGDAGGSINPVGSGCGEQTACWEYHGASDVVQGMRVTVVNSDGQMVSARSKDYLDNSIHANLFNSDRNYYRCVNNNRNRISYLKGYSSCNWAKHDGASIIKYANWLPSLFFDNAAAGTIKSKIIGMSQSELENIFFNDIGYTVPLSSSERNNHYLIIEPLTAVTIKGSGTYYGTYQELASKWRRVDKANWISSVINTHVPLSIFVEGNNEIKGNGGFKNGAYFNGTLKIVTANSPYTSTYKSSSGKRVSRVADNYFGFDNGFGIGIFWIPQLKITPPKCDYNNTSHFNSTTSGPNGEDCCQYVLDNLSEYNVSKSQLFSKYPRCRANIVNNCRFNLSISKPSCGTSGYGKIEDINDWDCIYASAYSSDSTIKNYFLKYGSTTSACSVYCRDKLEYYYPGSGMIALAGNYFTIGNNISNYSTYIDSTTDLTKVRAAILGPVKTSITRQCSILGTANSTCIQKRNEQLNKIDTTSPQIEFSYESDYYNNPVETLKTSKTTSSITGGSIKQKNVLYTYSLKDSTYKFVAKNIGISYKNASSIGKYPYINIGPHLPIHFSEVDEKIDFQITIKKFNLPNFDSLVLQGQTVATKFVTSIETYIQNLITEGRVNPKNINGLYYLDQSFIDLLKKNNYDETSFLQMDCANTSSYTCSSNKNGIYCYDKGKYTDNEATYDSLKSCIRTKVNSLTSQKASYKNDMLYSCNFSSEGYTDDPNNPSGINVIFRPISLNNPFPGKIGNGRTTGYNWCYGNNCSNTNDIVKAKITNNRSVETEEIYKDLDPLYTITLNPATIKSIRSYNDENKYDDFNLTCSNGNKCLSKFIRDKFENYFSGCGISGRTRGLDCARNDAW